MSHRLGVVNQQAVPYALHPGGVAVITMSNPPLNAFNHANRKAVFDAVDHAESNSEVKAIVITGQGRAFSAGADILEFSDPEKLLAEPNLVDLLDRVERCAKPVVSAVNGLTMGGGTEMALATHYRLMSASAYFALPEIKLGLIPGAGGTQRLPRLCGIQFAIQMCCTGGNVRAPAAMKNGLVDALVPRQKDVVEEALDFARKLIAEKRGPRRTSEMESKLGNYATNYFVFRAAHAQVSKATPPGMISPLKALEAVQACANAGSFAQGMAAERKIFEGLAKSPQAAAMQHFFASERRATKIPGIDGVAPAIVANVGVIGGGTMGAGIARCFMTANIPVTIVEATAERQAACVEGIQKELEASVKKGRLTSDAMMRRMSMLTVVIDDYSALKDVDYVVEAVFESMDLKKKIFERLDKVCKPGCVLASNTSTLSIDEISSVTSRPQDVIGAHFFSPAHIMKLLELIRGRKTSSQTIATSISVAKAIRKVPVLVGNCFGFVANRMILKAGFAAGCMLEEGALPVEIDKVVKHFGFPVGPFAMQDIAGLDVGSKITAEMPVHLKPKRDVTSISSKLVAMGRYGQKTGKGWHTYAPEKPRDPLPDSAVEKLVVEVSTSKGIKRRSLPTKEIQERYVFALVNEAAYILQEGFAIRPSDIDVLYIYGFGFPPYRGGPCYYADQLGLKAVVDGIKRLNECFGTDTSPPPCPLLLEMVSTGKTFADMNRV